MRRTSPWLLSVGLALIAAGANAQAPNPDRDAFFGETHVHTGWSFDAYIFGNTKTNPADAISVSCAIFLILEMDRPFEGLLQVDNRQMRETFTHLGQ